MIEISYKKLNYINKEIFYYIILSLMQCGVIEMNFKWYKTFE